MITIAYVIVGAYIIASIVMGGPVVVDCVSRAIARRMWYRRNVFSHAFGLRIGRRRVTMRVSARYRSPFPHLSASMPAYDPPSYDTWNPDDIRRPFHADRVNAIPGTVRTSVRPDVVFDCDPEPFRRG